MISLIIILCVIWILAEIMDHCPRLLLLPLILIFGGVYTVLLLVPATQKVTVQITLTLVGIGLLYFLPYILPKLHAYSRKAGKAFDRAWKAFDRAMNYRI